MRKLLIVALALTVPTLCRGGELSKLLKKALESSPKLEVVKEEVKATHYKVKETWLRYAPTLKFSYSYTDLSQVPSYTMGIPGVPIPPTSFSLFNRKFYKKEFSLSFPLFTGGRVEKAAKALSEKEKALKEYLKEVKREVLKEVKEDYYNLLKAKALVETAESSLKAAKEHYRVVKAFYDQEIVPRRDLLEAEVKVSQAEEEVEKAKGAYRVALEKLRIDSGDFNFKPKGELPQKIKEFKGSLKELIKEAYINRGIIKEAERLLRATKEEIGLVKAQFMPQGFVKLSYQQTDQYPLNGNFASKSASFGIEVPIFNGGRRFCRLLQAERMKAKAKAQLEELKRQVRLQVVSAYTRLKTARKRIEVAKKRVEEAKELLRDSKERYKEHVGTSTEVVDAITYLTQARSSLIKAIADYYTALSELEFTVGR